MGRTARTTTNTDADGWGRARLMIILAAGLLAVLAFVVGLGFAAHYALRSTGQAGPANGLIGQNAGKAAAGVTVDPTGKVSAALGQARRDQLSAAPMLAATPEDSRQGTPAATPGPFVRVPTATRTGPAAVPTGFTHTPAGAVGQLAAIEATVLQGMSIPQTNQVHQQWTLPGAPDIAHWPLTLNVQRFLATARQGQTKDPHRDRYHHPGGRPGQRHGRSRLGPGLRPARCARRHQDRFAHGLRVLRTDAVGR